MGPATCPRLRGFGIHDLEKEKLSVLHVGHFYCGLHLIVNFESEVDTALKTVEAAMLEGKNPFSFGSSESGTFRLIRTT